MELLAVIVFSLVLITVKDGYADDRLSAFARRLDAVEDSAANTKSTMLDKFKELKFSLKDELTGTIVPPLINRQVKQAITDLMKEDYIGNIISAHVLEEVHSLKSNVQNIKTQFKALSQKLIHVEKEKNMYREDLGKVRDELNVTRRDIRVLEKQARSHTRMSRTELDRTMEDPSNTRQAIVDFTQDVKKMNRRWVKTRKEVQSCRKDLEEMKRTLPADIDRINTELIRTILDQSSTRQVMDGLTQDVKKLTTCCVVRNETVPGTTTAPTDPNQNPSLSTTVPPVTVTTEDSDQRASTDPNQHPSLSTTVPPVTTQDPDQHATPSAATGDDLWRASKRGDLETVRRIVAAGRVDVNYRGGRWSRTPVMEAARYRRRDVVEFLVDEGADTSLVDSRGDNILHLACDGGHLETVKLILSLNVVDINSRGWLSRTPVIEAAHFGHREVVAFLVGEGADLSLVGKYGYNVLHWACRVGDLEMVKLILSLDVVDINARANDGHTAADWARLREYQRVVDLLVSRGGTLTSA